MKKILLVIVITLINFNANASLFGGMLKKASEMAGSMKKPFQSSVKSTSELIVMKTNKGIEISEMRDHITYLDSIRVQMLNAVELNDDTLLVESKRQSIWYIREFTEKIIEDKGQQIQYGELAEYYIFLQRYYRTLWSTVERSTSEQYHKEINRAFNLIDDAMRYTLISIRRIHPSPEVLLKVELPTLGVLDLLKHNEFMRAGRILTTDINNNMEYFRKVDNAIIMMSSLSDSEKYFSYINIKDNLLKLRDELELLTAGQRAEFENFDKSLFRIGTTLDLLEERIH